MAGGVNCATTNSTIFQQSIRQYEQQGQAYSPEKMRFQALYFLLGEAAEKNEKAKKCLKELDTLNVHNPTHRDAINKTFRVGLENLDNSIEPGNQFWEEKNSQLEKSLKEITRYRAWHPYNKPKPFDDLAKAFLKYGPGELQPDQSSENRATFYFPLPNITCSFELTKESGRTAYAISSTDEQKEKGKSEAKHGGKEGKEDTYARRESQITAAETAEKVYTEPGYPLLKENVTCEIYAWPAPGGKTFPEIYGKIPWNSHTLIANIFTEAKPFLERDSIGQTAEISLEYILNSASNLDVIKKDSITKKFPNIPKNFAGENIGFQINTKPFHKQDSINTLGRTDYQIGLRVATTKKDPKSVERTFSFSLPNTPEKIPRYQAMFVKQPFGKDYFLNFPEPVLINELERDSSYSLLLPVTGISYSEKERGYMVNAMVYFELDKKEGTVILGRIMDPALAEREIARDKGISKRKGHLLDVKTLRAPTKNYYTGVEFTIPHDAPKGSGTIYVEAWDRGIRKEDAKTQKPLVLAYTKKIKIK